MLSWIVEKRGLTVRDIAADAFSFFRSCLQSDGSVAENPGMGALLDWDSVCALKALTLWQDYAGSSVQDVVDSLLAFLASREKSNGMLSWGSAEIGPAEYCTETSSEYISCLASLADARALGKAEFLRDRQRPDGAWEEVHSHIPKAFQCEASVTGFALLAVASMNLEPLYFNEALDLLAGKQHQDGHFGINRYYYCTYYYLLRSTVAALATYGYYRPVAAARDFILGRQRDDGSWMDQVEGSGEVPSPELQTSLALGTLVHAGLSADDPAVGKAIDWLLDHRRSDGAWSGGLYPYPLVDRYRQLATTQDVFTTAQVLAAFKELEK